MRHFILTVAAIAAFSLGSAQEKSLTLNKGEALDLLLLNTNPEAKEELDEYFKEAVPIAQKWGYQPQYSSKISEPPAQGNYWPKTFILATWQDYDKREKFTKDIVKEYPQFHKRRREIWPNFDLTYWKIEESRKVIFDSNKLYIATAYWSADKSSFETYQKQWAKQVTKQGGKIVLELRDGTSPFGYYYNPERFTITEWESREAFEAFKEKNIAMDHDGVKHVNQFILK